MTHEIPLPHDEALLAATLALMTAYAGPPADARVDAATLRRLMASKIVLTLERLRAQPGLSDGLRQVAATAQRHWSQLAIALH